MLGAASRALRNVLRNNASPSPTYIEYNSAPLVHYHEIHLKEVAIIKIEEHKKLDSSRTSRRKRKPGQHEQQLLQGLFWSTLEAHEEGFHEEVIHLTL